jgi:predicted tellurium resistance membrane protein TerC
VQIVLLDVVFSLDSVRTAVDMVDEISVMIAAVTIAILVMLVSAEAVSGFVNRHPTVKMLALSFLLLIGFALLIEGFPDLRRSRYVTQGRDDQNRPGYGSRDVGGDAAQGEARHGA